MRFSSLDAARERHMITMLSNFENCEISEHELSN